jgi:topoisomerase IV subunit A
MSKKKKITEALTEYTEKIIESRLEDVLSDRFATYSKYIIQERALPNVKDGFKTRPTTHFVRDVQNGHDERQTV